MAGGFEVDVPDIGIVEFPEGTTEDEAQNAIRRHRLTPTVTPTSVPGLDLIAPPPSLNKVPGGEGQFFQKQREKVLGRDPTPPYQEWSTAPLVNLPGPITVAKYVERKIDESQGNPIGKAFLKGAIEQTLADNPKLAGLGESGAKIVSGMTSPAMIGTAVAAPLLPAKLAAGAFSAWQGYNTVKDFPRVKQTILDPNVPNYQKWEAGGDEFASLAFTVAPLLGMTVAKLKSTMTPEQAANVLKEKLPAGEQPKPQPTTQEVPNAPQERQVQEGVQRERVGTDAQRVSAEASTGNIVQPAAEVRPQQPQPEAPQVPLTPPGVNPQAKEWLTHAAYEDEGGDVYTGSNHPEILENLGIEGFDTRESRNTSQFGFRTNLRAFVPREEAAKIAKASGQQLEPFEIGPQGKPVAHSDEVKSPTEPGKTIAEQKPLNPGGALKDLSPELQAKHQAASDAMRAEFEKVKKGKTVEMKESSDELERSGLSRDDIFKKTGMWKGPGGKWLKDNAAVRVPDNFSVRYFEDVKSRNKEPVLGYSLEQIIGNEHPLFNEHPFLRSMKIYVDLQSKSTGGSFGYELTRDSKGWIHINIPTDVEVDPSTGTISHVHKYVKVNPEGELGKNKYQLIKENPSLLISRVLNHEINHAIQKELGLPEGGSPLDFFLDTGEKWSEELHGTKGKEYYKRLAGEALSRLSEVRALMTDEQKASEPPWVTFEKMLVSEGIIKTGENPSDVLTVKIGGKVQPKQKPENIKETQSPTETLSTASQVKVKAPEGATFIRGTTKEGKTSVQPISNFKGDNPFKGEEWKKVEAGTMSKGKFLPMKGEVTIEPDIVGMGGAAYGEVAPTGFSESGAYGADIYGIAERVRKARAEAGVVEPVPPGRGIGGEESVERGRMLLEQGYDPEKALSDFEKTKRFSSDDMMVFRARGEQLQLIARRMEEQFGTDSDEYARAFKALSDWDRRLKAAQTESSRAFSAQQGETDIDTGSYTGLRRARVERTQKDFTPEQSVKARKLAKNVAKARKEADDANQMLLKTIDEEGKSVKPGAENKAVWDTVRKYASRGMDDFNDIVNKTASDLGMKVEDVRKELAKRPTVKRMTDEAYKKAQTLRRIHGNAKMWLNALDTPELLKQLESIPGFMFGLKVWGHGRVALGTHAPLVAFLPEYWKTYAKNYATMYKMVHDPAFYEAQMQDLKRRPNYVTAQRAGLQNDVFQYEDYVSPEYVKFFGAGRGGNRGYAVLKILRQDMFDHQWDRLPDELKTPEVAKMIAKDANHITGVTQKRAFKHANVAFFAPRLLASRMAWLIGDPAQTLRISAKWKTATPAEKFFAINQVKQKAWVIGTAMSMLAINQGMLLALGSKQKINGVPKALGGAGFDPMSSDFMKFKVGGMQFSYGNPMIALARLPLRLWATRNESQKQRRGAYPDESMITEVGRYFRTQLSPFSGLLADAVTKTDYANRPLPGTNLPVPSRIRREGKGPYTWPEYISQVALPIPFEEAAKEVWENGFGLGKEQLKQAGKALFTIAVMGGTGGRLTEDWRLKEEEQPKTEPASFQPPPGFQITTMQPVNQPPQR